MSRLRLWRRALRSGEGVKLVTPVGGKQSCWNFACVRETDDQDTSSCPCSVEGMAHQLLTRDEVPNAR